MAKILTDNWHLYPPPPHPDPQGHIYNSRMLPKLTLLLTFLHLEIIIWPQYWSSIGLKKRLVFNLHNRFSLWWTCSTWRQFLIIYKSKAFVMLTFHDKFYHLLCLSEDVCSRANITPSVIVANTRDLQPIALPVFFPLSCSTCFTPGYAGLWVTISWAVKRSSLVLNYSEWGRRYNHLWSRYWLPCISFRSWISRSSCSIWHGNVSAI